MSGRSKGAVVRIGVTDRDVLRVHEGDVAKVTVDARPGLEIPAAVSQVATVASPGSGTFDVEVRLGEGGDGLLTGLTAKVAIAHLEAAAAVVPVGAVAFGSTDAASGASVFVVDPDARARRIPVKVAFLDGDRAALAETGRPLDGAAEVVASGTAALEDGARVKVVR